MKNFLGNNMPILPWMITYDYTKQKETLGQKCAANAASYLDYQTKLSIHSKCGRHVLTSLACTIGTANSDTEFLNNLLKQGITTVCIDMSRGDEEKQLQLINNIRTTVLNFNQNCGRVYPFAIALELTGLRIRTGHLDNHGIAEVVLEENEFVHLTVNDDYECHCDKNIIYVNYKEILVILKPGNLIFVDYGKIILQVLKTDKKYKNIKCLVKNGGKLRDEAIIHLPNVPQNLESVIKTELITFGLKNEVDALILPRVRGAHILQSTRELLGGEGKSTMLIAKIEDSTAIDNIDEIIEAADAVIIARGELGMLLPPEKLFIAQKSIIAKCNKKGKPVYCGAHLLGSMSKSHLPTRAEMLDVANCILDGCDGLILSEEIINGQNPIETLNLIQNICLEAEPAVFQKQVHSNLISTLPTQTEPLFPIALSAIETATKCNAACIIILTVSGRSAKVIAQFRPQCPIIAVTRYGHVARKLNLWRAVIPLHFISKPRGDWTKDVDVRFDYAVTFGKYSGLIKAGDALVLVSSWNEGSGFTNTVRIIYASQCNCPPFKK